MPLILPGNVASATASTTYDVANSCRFNDGDSPHMEKTYGTSTDVDKCTISVWVKRGALGGTKAIFGFHTDDNNRGNLVFDEDKIEVRIFDSGSTTTQLTTTQLFRDVSAWYHIVLSVDTGQGTAASRVRLYVNGSEVTVFGTETNPSQDLNFGFNNSSIVGKVGQKGENNDYFDGYMAEFVFIDGLQLTPSSFGEFDEDSPTIWKPIDVSGLTFGTNGYYLDFEDSSNLGNDANGGTDFTVTNLAAADQSTDTPTNNFCVMNPLDNYYANATLSEGNLKMVSGSSRECSSTATIALSNGKWFWEYEVTTMSAPFGGIQPIPSFGNTASAAVLQTNGLGYLKTGKVETTDGSGGSTELASYATYAANDIIGVALDLDAATNIIYFYKNGALQGSGVNLTHVDSTANGHYLIAFGAISGQDTFEINFGNPITALDSANADANGYGAFEYAVPSGFFSICTKNLAEYG
jgi:hypothetical protein